MIIGWLDIELRWYLPVHQEVEGSDFEVPVKVTPTVCGVCSYNPLTGHPATPVPWPCPAVRGCQDEPAPRPRKLHEEIGNYRPRPRRGGAASAEARERIKGRKF